MIKNKKEKKDPKIELPKEFINYPRLMFVGNGEVLIENYKGLIEYSETTIRINTATHVIKFLGTDLEIKTITLDEIIVYGKISSVEFVN